MATFLYLSIYLPLPNTKEPKFLPIFFGPAFFSSSFFRSAYTVRFARLSAQSWRPTPRRGVSQNGNAKRKSKLKSRTLNLSKKKKAHSTRRRQEFSKAIFAGKEDTCTLFGYSN